MRTALAATAFTALALFTAAPTALATSESGGETSSGPNHGKQAERLMRAADKFDRRAGSMRTRAGRLRATALELRQEAEELAGTAAPDPGSEPDASGRIADDETSTPPAGTDPKPMPETDTGEDSPSEGCDWGGDDDLGFSREHEHEPPTEDGDATGSNGEEICQLLRTADRLEQRAGALDTAAARMQQHACKLREKAAKLLGAGGMGDAERMLKKAAKLRESAIKLRAYADELRETAFDGADVDDEIVGKVRALELKAAAADKRADRLEARAAAMTS